MIKIKRYLITLTLIAICVSLTSCGFVSYVRYPENDASAADLDERLNEYLEKIDGLSSIDLYREEERLEYKTTLLDAKNELNECNTVEELDRVFEKHSALLAAIPTDLRLTIKEFIEDMEGHISLGDYREVERELAVGIINDYKAQIENAASKEEVEQLFRAFEFEIFKLKTKTQYYAEELSVIKENLKKAFEDKLVYSDYEEKEISQIKELLKSFEAEIDAATTKEQAGALFDSFYEKLLDTPTIKELNEARKNDLILEWENKFEVFATKHSINISEQISQKLEELKAIDSLRLINLEGAEFLIKSIEDEQLGVSAIDDLKDNCRIYLDNMISVNDYRAAERSQITAAISSAADFFESADDTDAVTDAFESAKASILELPTNDALWAKEDEKFLEDLKLYYGENILERPDKMDEAATYEEMAAIIDYYAFYQTSNTEFFRDTFRIKLLYSYKYAQWEINEVYWYCELLRGAVGITGEIERNSSGDYLVVKLIPYAMATESNANGSPYDANRYESLVDFKPSPDSQYTPRADDFEAFPYLSEFEKSLSNIWNSHQLWYALEHGYIPEVVKDSPAERVLQRAEELLRELILDGMSDEEKIFAIFSWYAQNVEYDDGYNDYLYPDDREHFPDSLASTLSSFHAEGALFDNLAVCESYAKSMLILLRMEGIECYRVFLHRYNENAINNLGQTGYGSHAMLAIRMSDGKFYVSDPNEAYVHNTRYPRLNQLLVPWKLHSNYSDAWTQVFKELAYGETILPSITEGLAYNGTSIFVTSEQELKKLISDFKAESGTNICISIFQYSELNSELNILSAIKGSGIAYHTVTYKGLTEYILYK